MKNYYTATFLKSHTLFTRFTSTTYSLLPSPLLARTSISHLLSSLYIAYHLLNRQRSFYQADSHSFPLDFVRTRTELSLRYDRSSSQLFTDFNFLTFQLYSSTIFCYRILASDSNEPIGNKVAGENLEI